jgi:para-nitrobenzyl esterase
VKKWPGVRDATRFGAICKQLPTIGDSPTDTSSEDFLFVSVWTAEWPSRSRKPVMVWFPGGGTSTAEVAILRSTAKA